MTIYFYQAECGDAARIRYTGKDNKVHNIIIDTGFDRTFRHVLAEDIESIDKLGENIDLLVVSHIHSDHLGGALAYINAIEDKEFIDNVNRWLYNPPRNHSPLKYKNSTLISEVKSISQGDKLEQYIAYKNKMPVECITTESPIIDIYGMTLTILSPNPTKLNKLRKKYSADSGRKLEEIEGDTISEAKAAPVFDYHISLASFDLNKWTEDKSVENGSSIALLTELDNKRILWLADAHPSVITKSLKSLGYTANNPIVCDYVKIAHHGSKGNNSDALYSLIRCNSYIISANGENTNCLPTKECIARILRNKNRHPNDHYKFYFTYDNPILRGIFKYENPKIFQELNFNVEYLSSPSKYFTFFL